MVEVTRTLQASYDEQYTDEIAEWREFGGKYKAANILNVCKGREFNKVLDCGAGEGSVLKLLDASKVFSDLYAIEISDSGIDYIRGRKIPRLKQVKKFNGYDIPYPDKEFDMVYCSHVLEHVEHPRILLREIKRVGSFQVFEVPLDYSIGVDRYVDTFLSYGHINVYTPSLFRFLLKSEGYSIVSEMLTYEDRDSVRFSWYRNMGIKRTFRTEMKLELFFLRKFISKKWHSEQRYEETGYSAYTCLARGVGDLEIF